MEVYEAAKLKMQCLELAHARAITPSTYISSIVDEAKKYWEFVSGHVLTETPKPPNTDDDIPF